MLATTPEEARPQLVAAVLAGARCFVELRKATWYRSGVVHATCVETWPSLDVDLTKLSVGRYPPGLYEIRVSVVGSGEICRYAIYRTKDGFWVKDPVWV